jgi:hypothetical protein
VWAWENPTVWGNYKGANAYVYNEAWGKCAEEKLTSQPASLYPIDEPPAPAKKLKTFSLFF